MNSSETFQQALSHLDRLPPIPSIAQKILSLKINTEQGERALLELINKDPFILSKIVGLSNSPLFGTGRTVLTLHDAAALLGSKRVKMSALSLAMMSSITRKSPGLLNIQGLWQHSLSIAMTMDTLAHLMPRDIRPSDDEIYLAGLLHDVGFFVLDYIDHQLSDKFHARIASEPECPIEEIEAEMLEINHCELGAELARRWDLPKSIISVLRYHHSPNDERIEVGRHLVAMASMAGKLLPSFDVDESTHMAITVDEWRSLGIDPLKADEIKAKVQEHTKNITEMNS